MRDAYSAISIANRLLPMPGPPLSMVSEPCPLSARSMIARIALHRFPSHERGTVGERQRRDIEHNRYGLRGIGAHKDLIAGCSRLLCLLCAARCEFPRDRKIGIGPIGAEDPRLDASRQESHKRGFTVSRLCGRPLFAKNRTPAASRR